MRPIRRGNFQGKLSQENFWRRDIWTKMQEGSTIEVNLFFANTTPFGGIIQ